jgi:hypothetical protein
MSIFAVAILRAWPVCPRLNPWIIGEIAHAEQTVLSSIRFIVVWNLVYIVLPSTILS